MAIQQHIIPPLTTQDIKRFWSKVSVRSKTECWPWLGKPDSYGYGRFSLSGYFYKAHRVCYTIANGPIPLDLLICHSCDNPSCVNPGHLFLGTNADNQRDSQIKGRNVRGNRCHKAKLSPDAIRELRRKYAAGQYRQIDLAREYGIVQQNVSGIVSRLYWKHIS